MLLSKEETLYRPEIQTLRAFSILAVVFYHAEFKIFQGGFFGVDIFFVISGYLITNICFSTLFQNSNLKNNLFIFYLKRAKRILPILFFIILVIYFLSYFIFLPEDFKETALQGFFSILFLSNYYFYLTQFSYQEGIGSFYNILLHTWSLSLEVQFYLVYTIILIIVLKYFRKYLFIILLFLILSSLFLAQYSSLNYKIFSFYSFFTRFWEFLLGCIIALPEIKKKFNKKYNFRIIGLSLIFFSFIYFDNKVLHPSLFTLIPIIGTLIILLPCNNSSLINKLFVNKYLVFVGFISYSLYLWHFPVFAYFSITTNFLSNINYKILAIVISFALSIITFYLIERPFRHNLNISNNFLKLRNINMNVTFISFILILIFSFLIYKNDGYKSRLKITDFLYKNIIDYDEEYKKIIFDYNNYNQNFTDFSNLSSKTKKNIIIIGNSHGKNLFFSFYLNKDLFENYNFFYFDSNPTCLLDYIKYKNICIKKSEIRRRINYKLSFEKIKYADIIIFANRWSESDINSINELILSHEIKEKKIILTSGFPEFNFSKYNNKFIKRDNYYNTILISEFFKKYTPTDKFLLNNNRFPNTIEKENIEKEYYNILNLEEYNKNLKYFKNLEAKNNIIFLDQYKYVCNFTQKKCIAFTDSMKKIHIDSVGHQSLSGSEFFGKIIHKILWLKTN
jgi:peptidoglycan/LPS O-acetylase OafA/YrhL